MSDDTPRKVFQFPLLSGGKPEVPADGPVQAAQTPVSPSTPPLVLAIASGGVRQGVYPVGGDVLLSMPVFETVIGMLQFGSPEERLLLAANMVQLYNSSFMPGPS